jgi:glycosyltransferase involved in cell wall biosynthesis
MYDYSVGIPARNEAASIQACVESVFAQTVKPRCVYVCTNDCTDDTPAIVESLKKRFSALIHVQSEGGGKGPAWNQIFSHNESPFLMFVDGDVTINTDAARNLLECFSNNSDLVIAGGGSFRLQPKPASFFSKVSDSAYGAVDTQRFLNGKLYVVATEALQNLAQKAGVPLLPTDVISDGHFLEKLSQQGGGFVIATGAYAACHPITNFKDWLRFRLRVSRGRKQLMARYPTLFKESDFWHARLKNHWHRISKANTSPKKAGVLLFAVLREAIQLYVFFEPSRTYTWHQIRSTKRPL